MTQKLSRQHKDLPKGTDAYHVSSYTITSEPIAELINKIPVEIQSQLSDLKFEVHHEPKQAIPKLLTLKGKYPDIPILYNYLTLAYSQVGDFPAMDAVCIENYTKTPNYLFAKINYAQICLSKGEHEKIPEIFDNKFDLKLLYPDRDVFHITEFEAFIAMLCVYYHKIGENDAAKVLFKSLKKVSPDSVMFKRVQNMLYPSMLTKLKSKLYDKKIDHQFEA